MLGAALDGIDNELEITAPMNNVNIYHLTAEERTEKGIESLPGSLAEAMRELESNDIIKDALGKSAYDAFARAKWAEIEEHRLHVSDWEVERYLETA